MPYFFRFQTRLIGFKTRLTGFDVFYLAEMEIKGKVHMLQYLLDIG